MMLKCQNFQVTVMLLIPAPLLNFCKCHQENTIKSTCSYFDTKQYIQFNWYN
jgi:hypothetical protein